MTDLELDRSGGYGSATVNPMSGDIPDAVGDVLQTDGDGVAMHVHRLGGGGCCDMEGLDL